MPFASVKATYVKLPEPQRILVEHRTRQLHDSRPVGPEQCGSHRAARVDLDERETIRRKLKKVSRRNGFDLLGRRPVGLVVDDQHFLARGRRGGRSGRRASAAHPSRLGLGSSATIGTSARLCGPKGARTPALEDRQRLASRCPFAPPATGAAPRRSMKPSAAWFQLGCGRAGRCCSNACVSVPRRKRPSSPSAGEVTDGSDRSRGSRGHRQRFACLVGRVRPRDARARAGSRRDGSRGAAVVAQAGSGAGCALVRRCILARPSRRRIVARPGATQCSPSKAVASVRPAPSASCDEIVPAAVGTRLLAFEAGDVEPVTRARHGDVEQPVDAPRPRAAARAWRAAATGGVRCVPLTLHTNGGAVDALGSVDARQVEHRATCRRMQSSRYRAGTRSAPRGPWRRARSSPAPRRGPAPCRA